MVLSRFCTEYNDPVEAKNYDFRRLRKFVTAPNNVVESTIHMLMCGLGSGLVVIHAGYMECGLLAAMGMNVVLSALVGYCVCILIWSAQKLYGRVTKPQLTYPDIIEAAVVLTPWPKFRKSAKVFRYLIESSLMIHLYGSCCVLTVMLARNLKELVSGDNSLCDNEPPTLKMYIISLLVPCIVICMMINLKALAPFALVVDLFAVSLILIVLWYSLHEIQVSPLDRPLYTGLSGAAQFASLCIFLMEPVSYAVPIENNMDEPDKYHIVVIAAMPIYTVAMMIVGFFGYWRYGELSVAPITILFPFSPFAVILKVSLCIVLYVIYAMYFYMAFDIEWYYLRRNHNVSNHWFWERLYRTFHVVGITVIAFVLPNVTRLMGALGAISTCPIVLIYPPFIELLVDWQHPGLGKYKWRLIKCFSIIIFGVIIAFYGSYYNIQGMIHELSDDVCVPSNVTSRIIWFKRKQTLFRDLKRTDINYNLTYNIGRKLPEYRNITFLAYDNKTETLLVRNYDNFGLMPFNISKLFDEANFNTVSVYNNDNNTLADNNKKVTNDDANNVIPNNNVLILIVNNTGTGNNNVFSLITNNVSSVLTNTNVLNLLASNVIKAVPLNISLLNLTMV